MRRLLSITLCVVTLLLTTNGFTQRASTTSVPNLIRYGGTLKDAQGATLSSATLGVTFAIYKQHDGGAPVWIETQSVTLDANGQYTVLLGSTTATGLPGDLFSQEEQRWLGVQIQGEAEQARTLLVSVPYAFTAHEAETLGGLPPSAFVKAPPSDTPGGTYIGVPGSASQNAGAAGNSPSTTKSGAGIDTIVNCANAANGRISVFTGAAPPNITLCNSGIYEATPYGTGPIGILNPNPIAALDVTGATNTSLYYQIGGSTILSTPGVSNLFVGANAGANNTGNNNTFVGPQAGQNNTTGSNDIYVSNTGPASGTESDAIRIGSSQVAAYFAGIYGAATSGGSALFIDSSGKLGTTGGSGLVTSFNGRSGAVVPASGDYNFSLLGGTLGGSQLSGTYGNAVTLSNSGNSFTGSGTGLTGIRFSQLSGFLASSQLSGTYGNAVTLSNSGNVFYGDGSQLSGIVPGPGSRYYIQNTTSQQASANFNISGNGTLGGNLNANGDGSFGGNLYATGSVTGSDLGAVGFPFFTTRVGMEAGGLNGIANTYVGFAAGTSNPNANYNTFVGADAGDLNTTGSYNLFLSGAAYGAGDHNRTGNSNVYIENEGPSSGTENNAIRIGTQGSGNGQQNTTFIAGIYGSTASGGVSVYINSSGQLGTSSSSRRFKEQIRDMGDSTNGLLKLRPVTFLYKPEYDEGERTLQYGLIAEEVAKVYPELVAYDSDGQPYSVRYQYLTTMLLNEVQKQYHRAMAEDEVIRAQQQEIELLKKQLQHNSVSFQQRLSRLEELSGNKIQTVAQERK